MGDLSKQNFAVALCQINVQPLNPAANRKKILEIAGQEASKKADLVVFPELCLTGYIEPLVPGENISKDRDFSDYVTEFYSCAEEADGPTVQALTAVAQKHNAHIVVGMALKDNTVDGRLTNSSLLIGPSGLLTRYDKVHLWQSEKQFFAIGNSFPVAQTDTVRLGMQICYDIRFPEATRTLALGGANVVTNIWASFRSGDLQVEDTGHFKHRAFTRAQENGLFFLSCNRVGEHNAKRFMGHSLICAPDGGVVAEAPHEDEAILRAELDLEKVTRYRAYVNLFNDRNPSAYRIMPDTLAT